MYIYFSILTNIFYFIYEQTLDQCKNQVEEGFARRIILTFALKDSAEALVGQAFVRLKSAKAFRRFLCRGLDRVATEFGLLVTAHNIAKLAVAKA
jgi:hypothetical protein